jgi:uncharacterized protein involved in exopolysaccharide biosynthesis
MASGSSFNNSPARTSGIPGNVSGDTVFDPQRMLGAVFHRKIMIGGLVLVGLALSLLYVILTSIN